jgi:hypothetical protein
MKIPFLTQELIRKNVHEVLNEDERVRRKPITFPIDATDVFQKLFDLETIYDMDGVINDQIGNGIIGCLFPDGHPSPWRRDKLIVVNVTRLWPIMLRVKGHGSRDREPLEEMARTLPLE